jgi:hypothetical protein
MEVGADHECRGTAARGVQAPHQDPDRAAQRRDGGDAVLGLARLRPEITMRKVDGWQSLGQKPTYAAIDLAA